MTSRIRSCILIFLLPLVSQVALSQQAGPYTYEDVRGYVGKVGDGVLVLSISERRVTFDPTAAQIAELKKLGASDRLIGAIKDNPAPGAIQIVCKPVDCEFSVITTKPQWEGRTQRGEASHEMAPGTYGIEVRATGYMAQTAIVPVILAKTEKREFNLVPIPQPPTTGTVVVTCGAETAECQVRLDGGAAQSTIRKQFEFSNVSPGEHRIEVSANGFQNQTVTIPITTGRNTISVTLRAGLSDPQLVFDRIEKALGGENYFTQTQILQAETNKDGMTISDGAQINAHYVESVIGQRIRWDVTLPNNKFWRGGANLNGNNAPEWWVNDNTGSATATGKDFNRSLQAYKALRLSELMPLLRETKYRKVLTKEGELTVTGSDGVYRISYDEKTFWPTLVQREPAGAELKTEIRFGRYIQAGALALPCTMEIRFPDRPSFSLKVAYLRYLLMPDILKSDFNKSVEKVETWNKKSGNEDVVYCPQL